MNNISKNDYIRIPTQESENIQLIPNEKENINSQIIISKLVKELVIFNIISSIIIISIIIFFQLN